MSELKRVIPTCITAEPRNSRCDQQAYANNYTVYFLNQDTKETRAFKFKVDDEIIPVVSWEVDFDQYCNGEAYMMKPLFKAIMNLHAARTTQDQPSSPV